MKLSKLLEYEKILCIELIKLPFFQGSSYMKLRVLFLNSILFLSIFGNCSECRFLDLHYN